MTTELTKPRNRLALMMSAFLLVGIGSQGGLAEPSTNLPPITVEATRADRPWTHADSDATVAALDALPGVIVNSQGGDAGQNDLSIRGSTFSGAGLSIGGLSLRNPQTEHFNLELPFPSSLLSSPRVLTGLDQAIEADGHLVGTVSFDLAPVDDVLSITAGIGETSRQWQDVLGQTTFTEGDYTVGLSAFGGQETAKGVDYDDNDVDRSYVGGHVQVRSEDSQLDIIAAQQTKDFGARGYYGVTSEWAAEEGIEDTLVLVNQEWRGDDDDYVRLSAAWRETKDAYTLFWTSPGVYENRHTSEVITAFADGVQSIGNDGLSVAWRAGVESEDVRSRALGDHSRDRGVVSLIPSWEWDRVTVRAGVKTEAFTGDAPAHLPQGGIETRPGENHVLYASYTTTVRQPSYTELNYESPGSLGNSGLERQEAANAELGWRCTAIPATVLRAAAFRRRSWNTVDWVLASEGDTRWTATDVGTVDTSGIELEAAAAVTDSFDIRFLYGWVDKDDDLSVYASRYVLDYAEHLLKVAAVWRATDRVRFVATQVLMWQNENPMRTGDDSAVLGALSCFVRPWRTDAVEIAITADNMWDDTYQIHPGQDSSGSRVSASLAVRW